jgi:hypothetical protein
MTRSLATLIVAASILAGLAAGLPAAGAAQISIAPKIGTLGVGADVGLSLGRLATIRGGYGTVPTELKADIRDVAYEARLPDVVFLGVDLHPGGGGFRISGGVLIHTDDVILDATPDTAVELGEGSYTPTEVGTLRGTAGTSTAFPFAMIGFGHHGGRGFGVFLDLGVGFMNPALTLTHSGAGADGLAADLVLEAEELESDLRFWPIVQVGITLGLGGG